LARTLFEKIWDAHVVRDLGGAWALMHIDRHLLHDLSGPPALAEIAKRGLRVRNPELTFAVPDQGRSDLVDVSVFAVEPDDVDAETFSAAQQVGINAAPECSQVRTRLVSSNEDPADPGLAPELD
jgi:homoaconitase/3-isopropylmalate dehydratase large subunit